MRQLFLFAFLLPVLALNAQTDITNSVVAAFKKADAGAIATMCTDQVELSVSGQEELYSREEAKGILNTFFSHHAVKSFTIKHQGTSKMDDQYRIGELITATGAFRVTFFMKRSGNSMQIRQLKIESPDDY
ncbi:MAG: DUF4783 domain-containing protein [Flavobacteriales bacterium]|nr:DUF4783 domain-containing protein [Flavobacteriales bacterium]